MPKRLYKLGPGDYTDQLPPGADPDKVMVLVRPTEGGFVREDISGTYNTPGRIYITLTALAAQEQAKKAAALQRDTEHRAKRAAARQECEAANREYQQTFRDRQNALNDFRSANHRHAAAESAVARTSATVDNISLFTSSTHDFVNASTIFLGLATRTTGLGYIADAINLLNARARAVTQSGLFGIVPGSTVPTPGLIDAANEASTIASALGRGFPAVTAASPLGARVFTGGYKLVGSATNGYQAGNNIVATGNFLRSQEPLLGPLNDPALADKIRAGFKPGPLEWANGLSADGVADELDELKNASDARDAAVKKVRENPQSGVDAARTKSAGMCVTPI